MSKQPNVTIFEGQRSFIIPDDKRDDYFKLVDDLADALPRLFQRGAASSFIDAAKTYRLDRMKGQTNYIELWVEKDALSSVLSRKTRHYHVRLMVNRGYSSTTAMYDAYNRFVEQLAAGKTVNILYLGDHDPSGLDMVRDIQVRILKMLIPQPGRIKNWFYENVTEEMVDKLDEVAYEYETAYGNKDPFDLFEWNNEADGKHPLSFYIYTHVKIIHIGLTTEQVRQYNPPPNPAKLKDPRANWYVGKFGKISWEVDALNPETLHQIIDDNIIKLVDMDKFNEMLELEKTESKELASMWSLKTEYKMLEEDHRNLAKSFDKIKNLVLTEPEAGKAKTAALSTLKEIKDIVSE